MDHIHTHDCCHDHEHGHDHEHSHDHSAHAQLDSALTLSRSWTHTCAAPRSPAQIEGAVTAALNQVAALLEEDGAILGHIKALAQSGEDGVALSITRTDTVDRTPLGTWDALDRVDQWALTVNVLSLIHTQAVNEEVLERLFAPCFC
jgi:hypothetical protein